MLAPHCTRFGAKLRPRGILSASRLKAATLFVVNGLRGYGPFRKERMKMQKTIIRIILTLLLLTAWGSAPVMANGPGIPPYCYPNPCPPSAR
jgi:hypothetical protein